MSQRAKSHIAPRLREAAEEIDENGVAGQGSNKQAVYSAKSYVIDGYYSDGRFHRDLSHYIGVDLEDEKFLQSMTGSVQYILSKHGLMYNTIDTERFDGYQEYTDPIEHDWIFHVVDLTWLPEEWV